MRKILRITTVLAVLGGFLPMAVFANAPAEVTSTEVADGTYNYYYDNSCSPESCDPCPQPCDPCATDCGTACGTTCCWLPWVAAAVAAAGIIAIAVTNNQTNHSD